LLTVTQSHDLDNISHWFLKVLTFVNINRIFFKIEFHVLHTKYFIVFYSCVDVQCSLGDKALSMSAKLFAETSLRNVDVNNCCSPLRRVARHEGELSSFSSLYSVFLSLFFSFSFSLFLKGCYLQYPFFHRYIIVNM